MPASTTLEASALGQVEHIVEEGTTSASSSAPPAKEQGKRRAKSTVDGPQASKKRRISKATKEKPSTSTRKQSSKNAGKAPASTLLVPEAQGSLIGIVSCEERPKTAGSFCRYSWCKLVDMSIQKVGTRSRSQLLTNKLQPL